MNLENKLALMSSKVIRQEFDLRGYQLSKVIPFLLRTPYSAAYVDMGLGKTISVLTVLSDLFTTNEIRKVLIIAPLRVAIQTWPTEIREWEHTWWMTHTLIRADERHPGLLEAQKRARAAAKEDVFGSPNNAASKARTAHIEWQKQQLAETGTMIHIINREAVEWLVDYFGKRWPYDCVIVDESKNFADKNANRWKALNRVRPKIKRMHLLSGVPAPEGLEDYFAQIYLLDRGERFGKSIVKFREKYLIHRPYEHRWIMRDGADTEVASVIAPIALVMREQDHLDREEDIVIERPIVLEPEELALYKKFEKTSILSLPDAEIEAVNGGSLAGKLLQMASGAVYDETGKWHFCHDHKIEEIKQLREEAQGSPLLIAYWHRSSRERLQKAFPKAVTMDRRGDCVVPWNKGKIDMLLVHPRSAGHGLNMQLGPGHTLVWFDNPQPLDDYLQTCKRLSRPGQRQIVRRYHLVAQRTIDTAIVPSLRQKDHAQDLVKKYIRDLRNRWEPAL